MNFYLTENYKGYTLVAHACNSTYLGGRDQEDHSLRPPQAKSSQDPILKIPNIKKGLAE
jgi:hypothetical protein